MNAAAAHRRSIILKKATADRRMAPQVEHSTTAIGLIVHECAVQNCRIAGVIVHTATPPFAGDKCTRPTRDDESFQYGSGPLAARTCDRACLLSGRINDTQSAAAIERSCPA